MMRFAINILISVLYTYAEKKHTYIDMVIGVEFDVFVGGYICCSLVLHVLWKSGSLRAVKVAW